MSGLGGKWKHGYGRWVRVVLVWGKAPLLFRNELAAVDGLARAARAAEADEVKRLGNQPVIVPLVGEGVARGSRSPLRGTTAGGPLGQWSPLRPSSDGLR